MAVLSLSQDAEKGDDQAGQRGGLGGNDDLAGLVGVEFLSFAGDDLEAMGPEIGWGASGGGGLEGPQALFFELLADF